MKKGRIEINNELCKGCDYCVKFCPKLLIEKDSHQNKSGFCFAVFRDLDKKCNACKICAIVCPEAAIEIFKETDCQNNCGGDCECEKGGDNE